MSSACDTCDAPRASLKCDHCHLFRFCSEECSNELAEEHHAVCYDAKSCDMEYLGSLLDAIGLDPMASNHEDAHECIAEHLATHDFTPAALELIERRVKRVRKPKKPRKSRTKTVNKAKRKARVQTRRANRRPRRQRGTPKSTVTVVRPTRVAPPPQQKVVVVQPYGRQPMVVPPSSTTTVVVAPKSVPTRGNQRVVTPQEADDSE